MTGKKWNYDRNHCMTCLAETQHDLCSLCTASLRRGRCEYEGLVERRLKEREKMARRVALGQILRGEVPVDVEGAGHERS